MLKYIIIIAILGFFAGTARKVMQYHKMPMHTRWELYSVPAETGKGEYGGSFYEEQGWWHKEHKKSLIAELIEMGKEMLFIKTLFENQKYHWWVSYAFHLGLYFMFAFIGLTALGWVLVGLGLMSGLESGFPYYFFVIFTDLVGLVGLLITFVGSLGLFLRRALIDELRRYSHFNDYLNLILLMLSAFTGLLLWAQDLSFSYVRGIMYGGGDVTALMVIHFALFCFLLVYIPLTKMSHYVGKYYTFHKVRWDNEPNLPGNRISKAVSAPAPAPSVTWSAPHISGKKEGGDK